LKTRLGNRSFEFYPQIGSSNDRAAEWLAQGAPSGSIVVADEQTKGRGRLGRVWYAPPGTALMFSYLFHPIPEELSSVGMMGALAVCEAVEFFGVKAGIKWPNDVQVEGRKLCGVLPEASWQDGRLIGVVLGIGLNVSIDFVGMPFEALAISLQDLIGVVDRLEVLTRLLERLDHGSERLASDDLFAAWRERLVMLGRQVSVTTVSGTVQGIAEDVERKGALLIRDEAGALHRMLAGDIALGQVS
jgi:BirA family biotin operon repressor/biotin-[acetyl-CoA-carboxylase] ligase